MRSMHFAWAFELYTLRCYRGAFPSYGINGPSIRLLGTVERERSAWSARECNWSSPLESSIGSEIQHRFARGRRRTSRADSLLPKILFRNDVISARRRLPVEPKLYMPASKNEEQSDRWFDVIYCRGNSPHCVESPNRADSRSSWEVPL